ncbi:MAG: DNA repair protein RecO [Chlorobiaceae bacterium]|nr:DNA repair protein RecO [Chlorobiaceae bacterium]NTV60715.1 DNA repair protein RecO [Chlorobiaceae bacterium]
MIVKTRAVVLKELKYRDQSKICSIYTRDFGKMSVMAKGARNPKNKLNGLLSAGNVVELVIYRKAGRELQLVSDANLVSSPLVPEPDLDRFAVLYRIIDIVRLSTENDERNLQLFALLTATLERLYGGCGDFLILYAWFLLRFVSLLGFQPSIRRCVFSGEEIVSAIGIGSAASLYFVMNPGGLARSHAAPGTLAKKHLLPPGTANLLCAIDSTGLSGLDNIMADPADTGFAVTLLQEYCACHLEHSGTRKNLAIVSQIVRH